MAQNLPLRFIVRTVLTVLLGFHTSVFGQRLLSANLKALIENLVSEGAFGGKQTSFCDLFRVENGKIAEHWDTIETIPPREQWKNDNRRFGFREESAGGKERKSA
jgi:hypothetical protein